MPASAPPADNDTPAGNAPTVVNVSGGAPVAVTLNALKVPTVKVVVAALVIMGEFDWLSVSDGRAALDEAELAHNADTASTLNSDAGDANRMT